MRLNIKGFFASMFGGWFDKRLWNSVGSGRETVSQERVSEETALNFAACWCATRLLCGTGASLPLPVYRSEDGDRREKFRSHPAYRLLNVAPNAEMTAFNFRSIMWQWQVNWGNAYAEIVREGGNPDAPLVELGPIHPSRVKICRDDDEKLYYEVHNGAGREETILQPWQMFHLPSIITHDGLVGRGVIEHARETIGAGIAAQKKAANVFGKGNLPAIVVKIKSKWDDIVRRAFYDEWHQIHAGAAGKNVALLQGDAEVQELGGFSAKDSQFLDGRQFDIEEIARWYGIPPHMLHHLLRATFNNVEELGIDFVRYSLVAWLEIWEQTIAQKLLTPDEQETLFVEHNVDALMRGNAQARAQFYAAMTNAAIMNRNECRKLENLDPVEGGDTFLAQGAMVPLDDDGKPESKFVTGAASAVETPPAEPTGKTDDLKNDPPTDDSEQVRAMVAVKIRRILNRDLSRMLTKESKAVAAYAKKPGQFVSLVDSFYAEHSSLLRDAVSETAEALAGCGVSIDRETLVAEWVREGKSLALEAAGGASANDLATAVQRVIESKTWSERPVKAVERINNATLVM